jgi:hypothetical protein
MNLDVSNIEIQSYNDYTFKQLTKRVYYKKLKKLKAEFGVSL